MRAMLPKTLFSHLGAPEHGPRIPRRVHKLILEQEARSERLISWVQLMLVGTFSALFAIAPRPADAPMSMVEPVPIALAAYALFTLGRLALSYRGFMPGWLLVASILLDTALLIGLIWSFHIQYGQPAAFSLKVPTFLYIFVFVALRALRFDHRFVLSAGLFAAAGWIILLLFALSDSPPEAVTRNFVTYMTSNAILLGAEFDKIFTVLLMTAILTLAVWRARKTLLTAVREQAAGREMRRFLSEGVAEAITGSETMLKAGEAAERNAAIVMLDIRGFTRFSTTVTPKQVVAMLTSFHARIVPIVEAHGGVVDKFLGDGVMVTFGAVAPSKSAAADALSALEAIMDEAGEWSASQTSGHNGGALEVNGAAVAGPVVFATLGNADRLEYTVIGEAVNLAAKLEKHNKVEGTRALVPAATFEAALAAGYRPSSAVERRVARRIIGAPEPLDLVALRA